MEFGKLANVDHVNWEIPRDNPLSIQYLQKNPASNLVIDTGAPAWSHKEWLGKIYPEKTKTAEYLYHYSRYFSTIELNTTHYQIPTKDKVDKWISLIDPEFIFCPKVYKEISHAPRGLLNKDLLKDWYQFISLLGNNLGPCFLQLPPNFFYEYKTELFQFLKQWPQEFKLALEFRHASWFQNHQILPALVSYLQGSGMGLVILDVAGRRDLVHTSISSDFSILRFIGNELHPTDTTRAQAWSDRFVKWRLAGLKNLFLFVHEPDDILMPDMHEIFVKELEQRSLSLRYRAKSSVSAPQANLF